MADTPKAKRPPKTPKEKAFVEEFVKNGQNGTRAAMAVYDVKDMNSASTIAAENLQKLTIADRLERHAKLRLDNVLEVVADGLEAKQYFVTGSKDDKYLEERDDYGVRHRYAETALKLHGHLGNNGNAVPDKGVTVNILNQVLNDRSEFGFGTRNT